MFNYRYRHPLLHSFIHIHILYTFLFSVAGSAGANMNKYSLLVHLIYRIFNNCSIHFFFFFLPNLTAQVRSLSRKGNICKLCSATDKSVLRISLDFRLCKNHNPFSFQTVGFNHWGSESHSWAHPLVNSFI